MIPGNEPSTGHPPTKALQWGQKVSSGTEEMVTLTKSQLQKLLRALGTNEPEVVPNPVVPISAGNNELCATDDDSLPSWVRRNSVASRGSVVPGGPSQNLVTLPRKLSSSHPELGSQSGFRPMSKLEQKQLQWEKERAEMQDWNPWGRPGAGAPRCQLVAAVSPRTDVQILRVQGTAASSTGPYPSRAPSPPVLPHLSPHGNGSPTFVRRVPPYMRSNVPFVPSYDARGDEKDEVKRRWLQELGCQREENQRRRITENQQSSVSNGSCWADNESVGSERAHRGEDVADSVWSYTRTQGSRGISDAKHSVGDERKQRALEYQRAIQAQMEEKQRRLRAEREAQLKEEREQEQRLEEERRRLEEQYQEEQRRIREKKEREEKTRLVLIAKMQQAEAEAEAVRKTRRKARQFVPIAEPELPPMFGAQSSTAGSAASMNRTFSAVDPHGGIEGSGDITKGAGIQGQQLQPQQLPAAVSVSPLRSDMVPASSRTTPQPQRDICSQTEGSMPPSAVSSRSSIIMPCYEPCPYIENRILTPTKMRIAYRARQPQAFSSREFGIQTDISLPCGWNEPRALQCIGASVESSVQSSPQARRVQHSRPLRGIHQMPVCQAPSLGGFHLDRKPPQRFLHQSRTKATTNGIYADRRTVAQNATSSHRPQELRQQHWNREVGGRQGRLNSRTLPRGGARGAAASTFDKSRNSTKEQFEGSPHYEETTSHDLNTTQSDDDGDAMTTALSVAHRSLRSPPVPALRKMLDVPHSHTGADVFQSYSKVDRAGASGSPPPTRKRWRSQEVYVPRQPFGNSPGSMGEDRVSPSRHTDGEDKNNLSHNPEVAARHRSVSVSGCRRPRNASLSPGRQPPRPSSQDPLVHPELVTGCPTPRQDKILQQLSSLRQGLLIKQQEMENNLMKSKC